MWRCNKISYDIKKKVLFSGVFLQIEIVGDNEAYPNKCELYHVRYVKLYFVKNIHWSPMQSIQSLCLLRQSF